MNSMTSPRPSTRARRFAPRALAAGFLAAAAAGSAIADVRYAWQPADGSAATASIVITDAAYAARQVTASSQVVDFDFACLHGGVEPGATIGGAAFQLSADGTQIDSGTLKKLGNLSSVNFTFGSAPTVDQWLYGTTGYAGPWSGSGSFVRTGPGEFTRTSPIPGGFAPSATPTFTWTASQAASKYKLVIATDPGLTSVILTLQNLTGTSYTLDRTVLSAGVQYYWQVTSSNSTGHTTADAPAGFPAVTGPASFCIALPAGITPPGCAADFNRSGDVSIQDIFDFLTAYFAGCP